MGHSYSRCLGFLVGEDEIPASYHADSFRLKGSFEPPLSKEEMILGRLCFEVCFLIIKLTRAYGGQSVSSQGPS